MRLGVSTFSLTNEWLSRRYTLESLLERVARGRARAGARGHRPPDLARLSAPRRRSDVLGFRRLCDGSGSSRRRSAGTSTLLRRRDRAMTVDECVGLLRAQIDVAARLGFPVIRLHVGVPVPALEQVVPARGARRRRACDRVPGAADARRPLAPGAARPPRAPAGRRAVALMLDFSIAMRTVPTTFADARLRCRHGARRISTGSSSFWRDGAACRELFAAIADDGRSRAAPRTRRARDSSVSAGRTPPPGHRSCR